MTRRRRTAAASGQQSQPKLALRGLLAGLSLGTGLACSIALVSLLIGTITLNTILTKAPYDLFATAQNQPQISVRPPQPIVILKPTPSAVLTSSPTFTPQSTIQPSLPPPIIIEPDHDEPSQPISGLIAVPTPHPMRDYTITSLKNRPYLGGQIEIRATEKTDDNVVRHHIAYPSDGLMITGVMQVPTTGSGPFPVVILNHGYIPPHQYWSGSDTWQAAAHLNRQGYLTIAPDFRNWGESDTDNSFFSTGQLIDVLNLISSLSTVSYIDVERIGMWGHSMGGGITLKAITIDPRIKAAILYAPVSGHDAEWLERWGPGCSPSQRKDVSNKCGGAEFLVEDIDQQVFAAYADAIVNPAMLTQTSAINFLQHVIIPVQIHIGSGDTRTPPEWADAINQRLRQADKEPEFFVYPDQGHAFQGKSWQIFMDRVTDFFDRHLTDAYGLG